MVRDATLPPSSATLLLRLASEVASEESTRERWLSATNLLCTKEPQRHSTASASEPVTCSFHTSFDHGEEDGAVADLAALEEHDPLCQHGLHQAAQAPPLVAQLWRALIVDLKKGVSNDGEVADAMLLLQREQGQKQRRVHVYTLSGNIGQPPPL